jgi:predicted DCC family thiol-disulfide oxidoreductase YuxK
MAAPLSPATSASPATPASAPPGSGPASGCPASAGVTQVMFDGSCPLCRAEVSVYQDAALQCGAEVHWVDVSAAFEPLPHEPDLQTLRRRFHVRTAQGQWLSGAAAFVHLWAQLPRWRLLAAAARFRGVTACLEAAYRGFLWLRPGLQAAARWASRLGRQPSAAKPTARKSGP